MGINLQKGQKISLEKGLKQVMVGLGWDAVPQKKKGLLGGLFGETTPDVDCDASVILCNGAGKLLSENVPDTLVYYGNLIHKSQAIIHQGDNLTGAGEGDDEQIMLSLSTMPSQIEHLVFVVNIYDADKKGQHFGMIENAFIRLVDVDTGKELCHYNLTENYQNMTGLIVGEVYRHEGAWKFNAIGEGVKDASRLGTLVSRYR